MNGKLFLVCGLLLINCMLHAQVKETNFSLKDRNNSVYFEALGNGGLFSINYERTVLKKDNIRGFLRAGASEWHSEDTDKLDVGVIGEAGVLIGGSHHFFDCGLGITLWTKDLERFVVPRIGYRYTGKKGLLIRVSPAMFIINSEPDSFGGYWIGIALGYGF